VKDLEGAEFSRMDISELSFSEPQENLQNDAYQELVRATGYYETVHNKYFLSKLIDAGFTEAYITPPEYDFRRDWLFICLPTGNEMPQSIMTEEPHWVLYSGRAFVRRSPKEPTERDIDRDLCRAAATKLWKRNPKLTIVAVIQHPEIRKIVGKNWSDKNVYKWIRDLCPNRRPGRRPGS